MKRHFTCISYNNMDFLIPSQYVASGIYLHVPKESKNLVFNKETLPHVFIGSHLEKEFDCAPTASANAVIVMNSKAFASDVNAGIVSSTDTAFPASGNIALSMTGSINSHEIEVSELKLFPQGIRSRLTECGICAIHFNDDGRKQILISPDSLLRRFFSGGLA